MNEHQQKIETHLHTAEVSGCAKLMAGDIVARFACAGYGALTVTDHLWADWRGDYTPRKRVDLFLAGYRAAAEAGSGLGIPVILGAEVRLVSGDEDYLVYGLEESDLRWLIEFLDARPTLSGLYAALNARDMLVVQAHPFRRNLKAMPLALLDGVEVYNGNPRHDSQNAKALDHAMGGDMIMTSGSDAHQLEDVARGGLIGPGWVKDSRTLVRFLKQTHRPERIETP